MITNEFEEYLKIYYQRDFIKRVSSACFLTSFRISGVYPANYVGIVLKAEPDCPLPMYFCECNYSDTSVSNAIDKLNSHILIEAGSYSKYLEIIQYSVNYLDSNGY